MPNIKPPPFTAHILRGTLDYDPQSGIFTWKPRPRQIGCGGANWNALHANKQAGSNSTQGYIAIGIFGITYRAHHLAWYWMTGEWPPLEIDHINRDRADNRWNNLRLATPHQNAANSIRRGQSTRGLPKGVQPQRSGRFQAKIMVHGRWICLGTYQTPEEAHSVWLSAALRYRGEYFPH